MNNRQLKAVLIATMCPIATPLKVQDNTKKTLEENANLILDMCGLKLDEPLTKNEEKLLDAVFGPTEKKPKEKAIK